MLGKNSVSGACWVKHLQHALDLLPPVPPADPPPPLCRPCLARSPCRCWPSRSLCRMAHFAGPCLAIAPSLALLHRMPCTSCALGLSRVPHQLPRNPGRNGAGGAIGGRMASPYLAGVAVRCRRSYGAGIPGGMTQRGSGCDHGVRHEGEK